MDHPGRARPLVANAVGRRFDPWSVADSMRVLGLITVGRPPRFSQTDTWLLLGVGRLREDSSLRTGQFHFVQEAFSVAFIYGGGLRATLKPQSTTSTYPILVVVLYATPYGWYYRALVRLHFTALDWLPKAIVHLLIYLQL